MKYLAVLVTTLLLACNLVKIPKEIVNQYNLANTYEFTDDDLRISLKNTLRCPMRIWILSEDSRLKTYFDQINPVNISALGDTVLHVEADSVIVKEIEFGSRFGDINEEVKLSRVELPFQKNKRYRLIQGYDSTPTHNTDWSRYALDFGLEIGDTICAATQGYVVGVVEDYKYGGSGKEWKNFGNFITIYDSRTGLYTQYVHLKEKGSFVSVGDRIEVGQNIGLAGITGQTNIEHLHFNCLRPSNSQDAMISIPIDSIGKYSTLNIKKNDLMTND